MEPVNNVRTSQQWGGFNTQMLHLCRCWCGKRTMSRLPSCQAGGWMTGKIMRNMMITLMSEHWRLLTVELKTASPELLCDGNNHMNDFTRSELSVLFPLSESHDCSGAMWRKIILTMSAVWFPQTETEQEDAASYTSQLHKAAPLCASDTFTKIKDIFHCISEDGWIIYVTLLFKCVRWPWGVKTEQHFQKGERTRVHSDSSMSFPVLLCNNFGLSTYYSKRVFRVPRRI